MTIEIEAGASQSQFSVKLILVHALFSEASPGTAGYPRLMQTRRSRGHSRRDQFVFERDIIPKPSA
jgi:hypothetical protein